MTKPKQAENASPNQMVYDEDGHISQANEIPPKKSQNSSKITTATEFDGKSPFEVDSKANDAINMLRNRKYIIFDYPDDPADFNQTRETDKVYKYLQGSYNKKFVLDILKYNGFIPTDSMDFNIAWLSSPEVDELPASAKLQSINHFPYSKQILGNKAELTQIIQSNPNIGMFEYFYPKSYILPRDRDLLYRVMKSNPNKQYISKPPNGSCGHGIKLVNFSDFYSIQHGSVVSEYISRPLCIDGFKFDLRIYVLVTSWAPLRAFICKEGLARFATESYSTVTENPYSHLTNATLNKQGEHWCSDFKWKLTDLLNEVNHRFKHSQGEVMNSIIAVVSQALALAQPTMAPDKRYGVDIPFFELYGFDVLLDRDFNAYLLEINTYPSLNTDEEVDYEVKAPMVSQALSIAGILDMEYSELSNDANLLRVKPEFLDDIDDEIVRLEDERNEKTGSGFIRLFPAEFNDDLQQILDKPKYAMDKKKTSREKSEPLDPSVIGQAFNTKQGIDLLVAYLEELEIRINNKEVGKRTMMRLEAFLDAQGYQTKNDHTIMEMLKNYIQRASSWVDLIQNGKRIPPKVKAKILENGDAFVGQILVNTNMRRVKEVKLLFGL